MRRGLILGALIAVALPTPGLAAERGSIEGVVMNVSSGRPQPGVDVTLIASTTDLSESFDRTATTDADGRFRFRGLETGQDRFYTIDAVYKGGLYPSDALQIPDDTDEPPVIETTTRVWEPTTDPDVMLVRRNLAFAIPRGDSIAVVESLKIVNLSDDAYIGRGGELGGSEGSSTFGLALPAGATESTVAILQSSLTVPQLEPTSFGMALTAAIPPGETELTYSYRLAGDGGSYDLSRTALYPVLEFSVLAEEPLRVESNRLEEDGEQTIDGTRYQRWSAGEDLDPGDQVQALAIADAGTSAALIGGAIALGLLLVGATAFALIQRAARRRRDEEPDRGAEPITPGTRDDLVMAIARLDLDYQAGKLERARWNEQRAELKAELEAHERAGAGA
jgi:hypothetical protein